MARTPLARLLASAWQRVDAEMGDTVSDARGLTRRELMVRAGAIGVGAAAASSIGGLTAPAALAAAPQITVVGGGLAGLSAAYQLKRAGFVAQVYEASTRVGGRCWTYAPGEFAGGQISEHGGELIDQNHTELRHLVQELGFDLDNLVAAEPSGTEMLGHFFGQPYTYAEATADLKKIWQQIHRDVSAASYPTLYNNYTQRGWELDHTSLYDYLEMYVPRGHRSPLGQLLDVAYNIEYGAETREQSSLNMLYLLAYSGQGQMRIFGPSNEKYHVRGGNDQVTTGLAGKLAGQITTGVALTAIARNRTGSYLLTWSNGTTTVADRVVLALPFSLLRKVDYSKAGFNPIKRKAIAHSSMGANAKLHLQFDERVWYDHDCNGETYSDRGYQSSWEVSRAQPDRRGLLVNYSGGDYAKTFSPANGSPTERATEFLRQIEPVLPGITASWTGLAYIDDWSSNPWSLGSYSYWKVGAYTGFSGAEREASGACHFAGEHTSIDFQGYLNGAVESGYRAAAEILAAYK
ncbi:MAG: NAD(P)/FAD-dependent oxidoreductase [Mycobacteriales bacterium]